MGTTNEEAWAEGYRARMRDNAMMELDPTFRLSWLDGIRRNPYTPKETPHA